MAKTEKPAKTTADIPIQEAARAKDSQSLSADLESPDSKRRIRALAWVRAGGRLEFLDQVSRLLREDPCVDVRERAAWTLDHLRTPEAIPTLIEALGDPEFGVRSSAGWALVHLGSQVESEIRRVAQSSDNPDARQMAELVLMRIGRDS